MKKIICLLTIFVIALPLAFGSGRRDKGSMGKIVIYTSIYEDVIAAVKGDLKRQFPQYDVEFVYGGTIHLENRIASEMAANRLGCDILMVADPSYSLELKERGLLHPYKSREAAYLAFDYDPDGFWYPVRVSNMVLAYNPARNAKNSIPNSFYDFAYDARARNAVSMHNPLVSGTTFASVAALRDKYGNEYFQALGRQGVKIDYGRETPLAKLESGEYKVIMILEESILKKREEERSTLEIIYPNDGAVMIPSNIMIINDRWSANRNILAAEAIAEWFLSREGQETIVSGWMHSVRNDFNKLPYDAIPTDEIRANSIPVNWDNVLKQRDDIQARFEDFAIIRR